MKSPWHLSFANLISIRAIEKLWFSFWLAAISSILIYSLRFEQWENTLPAFKRLPGLTDCHFAFDFSASNLATSLRSCTDTSTFHTASRIRPIHTTERETPRMIMGMFGGSGQPGTGQVEEMRLVPGLPLNSTCFVCCCFMAYRRSGDCRRWCLSHFPPHQKRPSTRSPSSACMTKRSPCHNLRGGDVNMHIHKDETNPSCITFPFDIVLRM